MRKKTLFIAAGIVLLCLAAAGYYAYQKPHKDSSDITPVLTISAEDLYKAYAQNEADANKKFLDKVIAVKGFATTIQRDSSSVSVQLSAGQEAGGINCNFPNGAISLPQKNQPITVKGRCTGFLLDVNLADCVIE